MPVPPGPGWPERTPAAPYPPGFVPAGAPGPFPRFGPASLPAKRKGTKRKVFGIVFAALSLVPMVLGIVIVAQAYSNHQIQVSNGGFASVAWHNLRTDEVFPDYLAYSIGDKDSHAWIRQGIAKESSCQEALRRDFATVAMAKGCKTTLRATYVDTDGEVAATLAVLVFGSDEGADAVVTEDFDYAGGPGPLVYPIALPGTPAAAWTKNLALAGGAQKVGLSLHNEPYVAAISVGPANGARSVGTLPGQWEADGKSDTRIYANVASDLVLYFALTFDRVMTGKPQ